MSVINAPLPCMGNPLPFPAVRLDKVSSSSWPFSPCGLPEMPAFECSLCTHCLWLQRSQRKISLHATPSLPAPSPEQLHPHWTYKQPMQHWCWQFWGHGFPLWDSTSKSVYSSTHLHFGYSLRGTFSSNWVLARSLKTGLVAFITAFGGHEVCLQSFTIPFATACLYGHQSTLQKLCVGSSSVAL